MAPSRAIGRSHHQHIDLDGYAFEYPNLSLHSAAANSNLGLVKYALSNGQPANSVLNGVLPIHAAAAGGHEDVVRMLIENGASVDAPRLPRKYMNDKTLKGNFTLGTAGSTPLHFAAANGHIGVLELLLACGARPDKTEKLGKTPEQLALEQGHAEAADLLNVATRNFHEGGMAGAETDDDDTASITSHSRHMKKAKAVAQKHGLPNRLGSSPSTTSLRSISTMQSALHPTGRRLMSNRRSSESLASQAAAAIRDTVNRSGSMRRMALPHHQSERLMQQSSHAGPSGMPIAHRRPSLPSVFDKGAHPGQALRQKLGMQHTQSSSASLARPPPLNIEESDSNLAQARARNGSGSSRSLANVFTRQQTSSTWSSALEEDDASTIGSPSGLSPESEVGSYALTGRLARSGSEGGMLTPLALSPQALTAPAAHQSFFPNVDAPTASLSHSASTGSLPAPASYSARKGSGLPSPSVQRFARASSERPRTAGEAEDTDGSQSTADLAHRRANSSASNNNSISKAKGFFGRFSRSSSTRGMSSDRDSTRVSPTEERYPQLALPLEDSFSENESVDAHPSEAGDLVGSEVVSLSRLPGRPRGDSLGSTSSGSAGRSYAPSPLAGTSSEHLHPGDSFDRPLARTRPSRSGSTTTDPDLRQAVLNNTILASSSANASLLSGSPGSASSIEPLSSAHSAHSTAPSSAIWSTTSARSPKGKGPPRTPTGDLITPALASSMVRKAEQQLLSYDVRSDTSSRMSLSEQLAAYGESLAVERQVKRAAQHKDLLRPAAGTAAPMPYSWEKLGKDGTRTPVSRSEGVGKQPHAGLAAFRGPVVGFQQGPLDRRRHPAPTLRQEARLHSGETLPEHALMHNVGSSLRYEAVPQRSEHKHEPVTTTSPAQRLSDQKPAHPVEKSKDGEFMRRQSPDAPLLSPPLRRITPPQRKSLDRRSRTPDTGSASSSQVEAPRSRSPLVPAGHPQRRPARTTPHEVRADMDELELQRVGSIMSMKDVTPIAPLTIEGQGRSSGKVKRLFNALKGTQL